MERLMKSSRTDARQPYRPGKRGSCAGGQVIGWSVL
ncbi:hypothetical protein WP1_082 [Pseudomonas phage WP1]